MYKGDITHGGKTFTAYVDDLGNGKAILYGRLFWCGTVIEMASGGLYDEKELEKAKGHYGGPDVFTIGDYTYRGVEWTDVRHEASCACHCRGKAEFNYKTNV